MGTRIHLLAAAGALAASAVGSAAWAQSVSPAQSGSANQPSSSTAGPASDDKGASQRGPVRREVAPLPRRQPAGAAAKENGAVPQTGGQAAAPSAAQPHAKPAADAAQSPAPVWSKEEIAVAKAQCNVALYGIEAKVEAEDPIREGACGSPHVVKLVSIGRAPEVVLSPPATLTCDMVAALYKWMKAEVQPLARRELGGPIVKIETMSSYSCRNAYGRTRTNLSEHGRANALDIGGFATGTGDTTRVLVSWGPTLREMRALAGAPKTDAAKPAVAVSPGAQPPAAAPASPARPAPARGDPYAVSGASQPSQPSLTPALPGVIVRSLPGLDHGSAAFGLAPSSRLGGPKQKDEAAATAAPSSAPTPRVIRPEAKAAPGPMPDLDPKRTRFLREAHTTACKYFGTVLGPEANRDHQNHFHLDMAPRKTGNYCH